MSCKLSGSSSSSSLKPEIRKSQRFKHDKSDFSSRPSFCLWSLFKTNSFTQKTSDASLSASQTKNESREIEQRLPERQQQQDDDDDVWAALTFWTVEVSSRHSWMIRLLVDVKSLALVRGVLERKEFLLQLQMKTRSSAASVRSLQSSDLAALWLMFLLWWRFGATCLDFNSDF